MSERKAHKKIATTLKLRSEIGKLETGKLHQANFSHSFLWKTENKEHLQFLNNSKHISKFFMNDLKVKNWEWTAVFILKKKSSWFYMLLFIILECQHDC